jgi:hypothetical protein
VQQHAACDAAVEHVRQATGDPLEQRVQALELAVLRHQLDACPNERRRCDELLAELASH